MKWQTTLISPGTIIFNAIERIDNTYFRIALVVDPENHLIGTVTDGDVRRALLRNIPLDATVDKIMNTRPHTARQSEPWEIVRERLLSKSLRQVPIVDEHNRVLDLRVIDETTAGVKPKDNWVILMAGGEGTRLRPLTADVPKPLLRVGGEPILETTLCLLKEQGFNRFYISVNYKADLIKKHFGDGKRLRVEIRYLSEDKRMGTAGALSLIPIDERDQPLVVMNADLLTKLDFSHLINYHESHTAEGTMCVRAYDVEVPFGVVRVDEKYRITEMDEKPVYTFFVNAGIYVIHPDLLRELPQDTKIDMPQFLVKMTRLGKNIVAFPIREYWLDVGTTDSLQLAKKQFNDVFSDNGV